MAFFIGPSSFKTAKYRYSFTDERGVARIVEIHEDEYDNTTLGSEDPAKITSVDATGRGSVSTSWKMSGDDEYSPFMFSETRFSLYDTGEALATDLLGQLDVVKDKYLLLVREGTSVKWAGMLEPKAISFQEDGPIKLSIEATDGLGRLSEVLYIGNVADEEADNDAATLTQVIADVLSSAPYSFDFYVSTTLKHDSATFTAVDGAEKCPLEFTWVNEIAFTSSEGDDEFAGISKKAVLERILTAFGMRLFQAEGAWHLIQANLLHTLPYGTNQYRRWRYDSSGLGKTTDSNSPEDYEDIDPRVTVSDEDISRTVSTASFMDGYSSVISQYNHGKVQLIRRPGISPGTIREFENLYNGQDPWVLSGTAVKKTLNSDDQAVRIDRVDADVENTTGYTEIANHPNVVNGVNTTGSFDTIVNGNTLSQTTPIIPSGYRLAFSAGAYCDAHYLRGGINNRVRSDYILFRIQHNGSGEFAQFDSDGLLEWTATDTWCIYKNVAPRNDWFGVQPMLEFSNATSADGTITITLGPIFDPESYENIGDGQGWKYIFWDNINLVPADLQDIEATTSINYVSGSRGNPRPRTVSLLLGDGPSALNKKSMFSDILLSTITGGWEETELKHSGGAGVAHNTAVGSMMLTSMNRYRRVHSAGYPGHTTYLTPLDVLNRTSGLHIPRELDTNWASGISGGSWYLENEGSFTSDLEAGITSGFSGFTPGGRGTSADATGFYNRVGDSFDTLLARGGDRLATVSADATSGTTVNCSALAEALNEGDPVFFQSKKTGYVMKRIVAASVAASATSFTVTVAFSASEPINNGDPILPGSIAGLRIDMDGVQIVNTHLKNDGLNAWDGTVNSSGQITAAGTQGWIITRTGEAEFNDVTVRGTIVITGGSGIGSLTDAGALATADNLDDVSDGTTYKRTTENQRDGAGYAYTGLNSSGVLVTSVIPASNVGNPGSPGLFLGSDYLGYHNGSGTAAGWKTYMDSSGNFYLGGTSGSLTYAAGTSTLELVGKMTINAVSGFSGSGQLVVGSGTKDSTLNGWAMDSNEFVGQASGVDQVVLNTSGAIVAGGGDVTIDADGITINAADAGYNLLLQSAGTDIMAFEAVDGAFKYMLMTGLESLVALQSVKSGESSASVLLAAGDTWALGPGDPSQVEILDRLIVGDGSLTDVSTLYVDGYSWFNGVVGRYGTCSNFSQYADVTVSNTTTDTSLISTGRGTNVIPAGALTTGSSILVKAAGHYTSNGGSNILTISIEMDGTDVWSRGVVVPATTGNDGWSLDVIIGIRSATSALANGFLALESGDSGGNQVPADPNTSATTSLSNVETTSTTITVKAKWNTADANDSITCTNLIIQTIQGATG